MAEASSVVKIRIAANGPYIVRGVPALSGRQPMESTHGEPLAWEPTEGAANAPENPDRYAAHEAGRAGAPRPVGRGTEKPSRRLNACPPAQYRDQCIA